MVTVNDYLARRDSEWVGQVHRFLGLEVRTAERGEGREEHENLENLENLKFSNFQNFVLYYIVLSATLINAIFYDQILQTEDG